MFTYCHSCANSTTLLIGYLYDDFAHTYLAINPKPLNPTAESAADHFAWALEAPTEAPSRACRQNGEEGKQKFPVYEDCSDAARYPKT